MDFSAFLGDVMHTRLYERLMVIKATANLNHCRLAKQTLWLKLKVTNFLVIRKLTDGHSMKICLKQGLNGGAP